MFRGYFVSETAQVELKSGRVYAPASMLSNISPCASTSTLMSRKIWCSSSSLRSSSFTASWQGLTLVHFSAQPEPFLTQNTP